jgi:uncharacterized tellurite resistance protein B-like protein
MGLLGDLGNILTGATGKVNMACAVLLLDVAKADGGGEASESEAILQALERELGLKQEDVVDLFNNARKGTEEYIDDLSPYTNLINKKCTYEQKCAILTALWRVALADGKIDKNEIRLIRYINELLDLGEYNLAVAKTKACDDFFCWSAQPSETVKKQ